MKTEGTKTKYPKTIKFDDEEYDVIHPQAVAASNIIVDMWEKLGKPVTPFSKSGAKLMDILISVWHDSYPEQAKEWLSMRKEYQDAELDIQTQVKRKTGRSLASYPYPLFCMIRKVFPKFKPAERNNAIKMVKKWPMFRMAKKV